MINRTLDKLIETQALLTQDYGSEGMNLSPDMLFNGDNFRRMVTAPLSLGLKYQGLRSAVYAVGTLDFTSPFSEKLMARRYKMRALTGYAADVAQMGAKLVDWFVPDSTAENPVFENWLNRQMPMHPLGVGSTGYSRMMGRDMVSDAMAAGARKDFSMGLVEKFMYPRKKILASLRRELGTSANFAAVVGSTPEEQARFVDDFYDAMGRKMRGRKTRKWYDFAGRKRDWKAIRQQHGIVTPLDITSRLGSTARLGKAAPELVTPEAIIGRIHDSSIQKAMEEIGAVKKGKLPKFGWFGMKRIGRRIHGTATEALNEVYREKITTAAYDPVRFPLGASYAGIHPGGERSQTIAKALRKVGDEVDYRAMVRGSIGRVARWGGVGIIGLELAGAAVPALVSRMARLATQAGTTLRDMSRQDFGSGEILMTSRMATERQRSIEAMQNSGMNARMLLGSEASMYHGV